MCQDVYNLEKVGSVGSNELAGREINVEGEDVEREGSKQRTEKMELRGRQARTRAHGDITLFIKLSSSVRPKPYLHIRKYQGEHFGSQRDSETLDAVNRRGTKRQCAPSVWCPFAAAGLRARRTGVPGGNMRQKEQQWQWTGADEQGRGGLKGGGKGTGWRADGTGGIRIGYPGLGVEWGLVRVGFASKNARLKLLDRDIGANTQIPGSGLRPRVWANWANSMGQSTRVVGSLHGVPFKSVKSVLESSLVPETLPTTQISLLQVSLSLKFYNTAAGQCEHSGLCSVQLPTLAAEEEYWSTLIANHAQTMGNQRMRLGQRKEAQRWTVIQWFNQAIGLLTSNTN
ncbi:hypothetical protein B0H14DRAFT_3154735 [Mycena olivaceomarginata]|nr:hypothetical protein B0H14DRAFT_3154735 [Mycena olivaceomarginata]